MFSHPFAPLLLCLLSLAPAACQAQQNPDGQLALGGLPQPYLLLLRDPEVQRELAVSPPQRARIQSACDRVDPDFWRLRAMAPEKAAAELTRLTEAVRVEMEGVLDAGQRRRLAQIQLQLQGLDAFRRDDVAEVLRLTDAQRDEIRQALDFFQRRRQALAERMRDGEEAAPLEAALTTEREALRKRLAGLMSPVQLQAWNQMVGKLVDPTQLGRVTFAAPPLAGAGPWLNSDPLTDQELRGRVVVFHFWCFQCVNCQRNLPWYKEWHAALADRGVVVLGVHTPEVEAERDVDRVRSSLKSSEIGYPVLIDNDKRNWQAWGNTMWPTTYLIDKRGRVRYWWQGELNWQDAGAQRVFTQRIEELLAE